MHNANATGDKSISGLWAVSKSLALIFALMTLAACGGGGGGSSSQSGSLSYPSGTQSFTVGSAITAINPTITGTLSGFTVSPALPAGLSLDPGKGTITGTPTAITAAANYTVTAMVSGGTTTSTAISIAVNDVAPSQLSYSASSFTFSATVSSSTLTPKAAGGAVVGWSISPALPAGLDFNTTNGSISGTPTAPAASSSYVVTAQNSGGQSTVTLTIEVDAAPLINLGHQGGVAAIRTNATNVFSVDSSGYWIFWSYADATVVGSGNSGCGLSATPPPQGCALAPATDMAGTTAALVTPTGLELHATSDGHTLGSITTSAKWWKLATDGSYVAAGNSTNLSAWSASGQLLFSRAGDYSKAVSFAAPGQILVGAGAAGQNVVETIAVPSGTATTGSQFNGQFSSWFTDGGRFVTIAGTTVLIYSDAGVQQGSIASVPATATVTGQGNWVWAYPLSGANLSVYPATATNPSPSATYTFTSLATPVASGSSIGVLTEDSTAVSVIDLSGTAPVKTDYTAPVPLAPSPGQAAPPFAAASASQWLAGNQYGVLLDGASLAGSPRYFGFGQVWSVAGGTSHFALATASGNILYFNSSTLAQEGTIAFAASKVVASADGSVLVAQGAGPTYGVWPLEVYSLPTGTLQYTWPYTGATAPQDIVLSGSGTVLGQDLFSPGTFTQEAGPPTGGSVILTTSLSASAVPDSALPIRISPDGTLIAMSQSSSPMVQTTTVPLPGTTLYQNGALVTAFTGWPVGWLDNSRLVVNNYTQGNVRTPPTLTYTGCTIYGANGSPSGGACALSQEVEQFLPVTSDGIYLPITNRIVSVSTGSVSWTTGDVVTFAGSSAVAGSHVIFVSGTNLLAQSY